MTQLIASYELAIGCESTATLSPILPGSAPGFFFPGDTHERNDLNRAQRLGD